jgi:hypothetical protein
MTPRLWSSKHEESVSALRRGQRHARCGAITFAALLAVVAVETVRAQGPAIGDRLVAADGPAAFAVVEPAIAAGPDKALTVFYDRPGANYQSAWYATYDIASSTWLPDAEIDPNTTYSSITDLSVAYDACTGGFMVAAKTTGKIVSCRFEPDPNTGDLTPLGWEELPHPPPFPPDKPWIVAGDPNLPTGQEYYIVYMIGYNEYAYFRSVDGGAHWARESVKVGEDEVQGQWCAQPAVHGDRSLHVAYVMPSGQEIRFLQGEDVDGDPNDPNYDPNDPDYVGVSFSYMCGVWTPLRGPMPPVRVPVRVSLNTDDCADYLPGNFESKRVPYVAADPSNPNRLYIVYHDTASDDPNDAGYQDVNVYLQKLTKSGSDWILDSRQQINNDNTPFESDQFMPSVVVDDLGYIHVIFYDDRNYNEDSDQEDNQTDPPPKFDVFYAWSEDEGENWTNRELHAPEGYEEPAMDFAHGGAVMREYIGIAWYGDEEVSHVWTAFNGTSQYEAPNNKGLIWSSFIDWTPDPNEPNSP